MNVLFIFQREVTYTPRLLLVDLKGTLGYLQEESSLYNVSHEEETQPLWDDNRMEITQDEAAAKPPFIKSLEANTSETLESTSFDLEGDVKSWVDYLVPRYHPRTLNILKQYNHDCTMQPFNLFTYGRNLWCTEQFSEDFSDRIRAYVEECDLMQGFQACDHSCPHKFVTV